MFDRIREECGIFGVFREKDSNVASQAYVALYALQHRGQESCGIAVNDDGVINYHKGMGLVGEVFGRETLDKLGKGNMAVGHVRYAITDPLNQANAQPLVVRHIKGTMVLTHNGCIINADELRKDFEMQGAIFHTTGQSEVMSHAIIQERLKARSIEEAVCAAMYRLKGAYSLIVMSPQKLLAARDPLGFRPLCMGKIGESIVFASESCALDGIGASFVRDIEPGEVVVVSNKGVRSIKKHTGKKGRLCAFEIIYFARPDSVIAGINVHETRARAGELLARAFPVEADVVVGVPDSGLDAALGFSRESGIPYGLGFIKNRYVARTFIQPTQGKREDTVRIKLNVVGSTVKGKRVVLVDDSIVRGTTSARIVNLLRDAGATEVHMRVSAPPFRHPCYFGTNISDRAKLIANLMTEEDISKKIGVDSLGYLPVEGIKHIAEGASCDFCDGCFTGSYPMPVPKDIYKDKFESKLSEKKGGVKKRETEA